MFVNNLDELKKILKTTPLEKLDNEYDGYCPCLHVMFELPGGKIEIERDCWRVIDYKERPIAHYIHDYNYLLNIEEKEELKQLAIQNTKDNMWGHLLK